MIAPVSHATFAVHEFVLVFKAAVAIRITQPVEALAVVGIRIKDTVRIQQPPAFQQRAFDLAHGLVFGIEPQQPLLLPGQRDTTLRIKGHRHPRILAGLRRADQLRLESRRQSEGRRIRGLTLRARLGELP